MNRSIRIEPFAGQHAEGVHDLVASILIGEFALGALVSGQVDLAEVEKSYAGGSSCFWVALDSSDVVGTIGFIDLGGSMGRLRKMFVHGEYRRAGIGSQLLNTLETWAREHAKDQLYLRTHKRFLDAHAFYRRHGFSEIERSAFPAPLASDQSDYLFLSRSHEAWSHP